MNTWVDEERSDSFHYKIGCCLLLPFLLALVGMLGVATGAWQ